jgi:hypothetical protein
MHGSLPNVKTRKKGIPQREIKNEDLERWMMRSRPFPKKAVVWSGAILGGIVHATMAAVDALYASFAAWYSNHYVLNGVDGREGVITFDHGMQSDGGHLVGVFFFSESDRSPYTCKEGYDLERFFRGCPQYQRSLAEQMALPYLQDEDEGKVLYRVTTAFWDNGEDVTAADPWELVLWNGANLIENELIENRDAAFARFQTGCGMSPEQVAFARKLFERKMAQPSETIELTASEVRFLESTFEDPKATYAEMHRLRTEEDTTEVKGKSEAAGTSPKWWESLDSAAEAQKAMKACRDLFAWIGIVVPETEPRRTPQ